MASRSGLGRYAGRSVLSAVGIAISVSAMITLASLLHGVARLAMQGLLALGSHVLIVGPATQNTAALLNPRPLTAADVDDVRRRVREADLVAPVYGVQGLVRVGSLRRVVTIIGLMPGMEGLSGFGIRRGRFLIDRDIAVAAHVVVLSESLAARLGDPPLDDFVLLSGRPFRVVGIVTAQSRVFGSNGDDSVFIPSTTAESVYPVATTRGGFVVRVREDAPVAATKDAVRYALRAARRLRGDDPDDFSIQTQEDLVRSVTRLEVMAQSVLFVLMAIALVIAAIGILNSVLTSVLERTSEIGLRRAVGATRWSIQLQFLAEALAIAMSGSVAGVGLGAIASQALARAFELPRGVDWRVAGAAVGAALVLGAMAALWPAFRAGRLSPITALHHE